MTSFTTSFRKSAAELLRRPGSYAILPGVHDHHRDGLPRWTVERITELKTVLRVTFRGYPAGDAPQPLLPVLPAAVCTSTAAHS